jgi:hypothetical protein
MVPASGSVDRTVRLWMLDGRLGAEPFKGGDDERDSHGGHRLSVRVF